MLLLLLLLCDADATLPAVVLGLLMLILYDVTVPFIIVADVVFLLPILYVFENRWVSENH